MALLRIKWESKSTVAPQAASTGEATADADANVGKRYAERPMLVYVAGDDATDSLTRKLEDIGFADERVGIGSKFFRCIKVTGGNALQDRLLKEHGKTTPRLLFIKRDYTVIATLEKRKLKSGSIVKAMARLAREEYKDSFSSMVSNYAKLLNERDRLDGVSTQLAEKARKLQAKPNASKEKKLNRDKAAFEKAMESWKKSEEKLLAFRAKPIKKPAA